MKLTHILLSSLMSLGLYGCQTIPNNPNNSIAVDKTMVHSFHLGTNSAEKPYLLIVLNEQGIQKLEAVAKNGEPYNIVLDGRSYQQSAQVNTGFLVLNPAANEWTQARLSQLLK